MPKPKNEPIGNVECPAKGCAKQVPVFRFKPRDNVIMQRFANKLYCRCPDHGQFGGTSGDEAMQTYIEENSKKCEPKNPVAPAKGPAPQPNPPASLPAPKLPPTPAPMRDVWDL